MKIAVDLDGTLAEWSQEKYDPAVIGKPIPAMMQRVKDWVANGDEVTIFTARLADPGSFPAIKKWLRENGLPDLPVTNKKRPEFEQYWDDRAVAVQTNTGKVLGGHQDEESWEEAARKALE